METLKIKIEIGDRRFEADGPVDVVQTHLNAFMKLTVGGNAETLRAEAAAAEKRNEPAAVFGPLMRVAGTTVWLTVRPRTAAEGLLVLLLGQRLFRNNSFVSGTDLIDGLGASGHRLRRVDYLMNTHARKGYVAVEGKRRGRRYLLTGDGLRRAQELAQRLLGSVPTNDAPAPGRETKAAKTAKKPAGGRRVKP